MDVYTQVFHRNYATNDDSLELDWAEVEDWDYLDFGNFMTVKINRLITYLDEMKNSSGMSQYSLEGETFSSLRASIVNFRDIYLAEFNAFVNEKRLFKDPRTTGKAGLPAVPAAAGNGGIPVRIHDPSGGARALR